MHSPFALDIDGAEQMYQAQWFEWGFGIQPPTPTWLLRLVTEVVGHSASAVQFMRLTVIFFIYLGFFRLSRTFLKSDKLALSCTLSLVFILQFSSELLRQMHTVFVTLSVIYAWLALLRLRANGRWLNYLWLGVWMGVGLMSKYNFVVHIGVLFLTAMSLPEWRKRLLTPKLLITIATAAILCAPHYFWLLGNLEQVSSGVHGDLAEDELGWLGTLGSGLGSFVLKLLTFSGILTVVVIAFFFRTFKTSETPSDISEFTFLKRYMLLSLFALLAVVIFSGATVFHEHWLQPFFLLFPVFIFQRLQGREEELAKRLRVFNVVCLSAFLIVTANFGFKSGLSVLGGKRNAVFNVPYSDIAAAIDAYEPSSDLVLVKDVRTAGHLKMLLPNRLILVAHDVHHLKLEQEHLFQASNAVFAWKARENQSRPPLTIRHFHNAFGENVKVKFEGREAASFNYVFTDDRPYEVGMARMTLFSKN